MRNVNMPVAVLALAASFPLAVSAGKAQSSCGQSEAVAVSETIEQLADRCDTTTEAILSANPNIERGEIREGQQLAMPEPTDDRDWVERTRRALQDTRRDIEDAAEAAGRSASEYLSDRPDLNRDILEFGERLGLPGVSAPEGRSPELNVTPSRATPGSEVTLTASGLPASTQVVIAVDDAGASGGSPQVLSRLETDSSGTLEASVTVPDDARDGERIRFLVETQDERMRLASEPLKVGSGG